MAFYNRAKMAVSGTPGTGTITLGSAVAGFRSFASAGVGNGALVSYVIEDGTNWEIGRGTYTSSGTSLARTTILASSNSGSAISATSSAVVFITALAEDLSTFLTAPTTVSTTLWRLLLKKVTSAFISCATLEMHNTVGGGAVAPASYSADTSFSGNPASNMFDGNSGTSWASSGGTTQAQIDMTFSTPQSFAEMLYTVRTAGEGPDSIVVQASLDGGSTYITVATLACAAWGSPSTQTFSVPTTTGSTSPLSGDTPFYRATDIVKPASANFTLFQSGSNGSMSDTTRGIYAKLAATTADAQQVFLRRALPSTPYTVKMLGQLSGIPSRFGQFGLAFADSTGKHHSFNIGADDAAWRYDISRFSALGTFSADATVANYVTSPAANVPTWLKVQDDGTNFTFFGSLDGEHWFIVNSVARTTYVTPAYVGPIMTTGLPSVTSVDLGLHILSYSETAGLV